MLRVGFAFEKDEDFWRNNLSIYKEKKYNIRKYIYDLGNRKYVINENEFRYLREIRLKIQWRSTTRKSSIASTNNQCFEL